MTLSTAASIPFLLRLAVVLVMGVSSSKSLSSPLTRPSTTAHTVVQHLQQQSSMAPYVAGGTAVVTGGNSGIGAITVERLAQAGMHVVLCARNPKSAEQFKATLPVPLQNKVTIQHLDLADLDSVQQASQEIAQQFESIDCLVNNAGIMALPKRQETKQGLELQFGTNHVGHHYLTRLLLPRMSSQGRIVCVSSTAHRMAPAEEDWESNKNYSPWGAYGRSKLANLLFAKSLTDRLALNPATRDITAVSLHPGVIKSPLWKHTGFLGSVFGSLFANKDMEQGAATNVYCALVDNVEPGAWYSDCQPTATSAAGQDQELRKNLWDYTETILANKGHALSQNLVAEESEAAKAAQQL